MANQDNGNGNGQSEGREEASPGPEETSLGSPSISMQEVVQRSKEIQSLSDDVGKLFQDREHKMKEREGEPDLPEIPEPLHFSETDSRLLAQYFSRAWTPYTSYFTNLEFWTYVAASYATYSADSDRYRVPPRGRV